jgi:hypothetical protein
MIRFGGKTRCARVACGIALGGAVSLAATLGVVVSLSLLRAAQARRSEPRLAAASQPAAPRVPRQPTPRRLPAPPLPPAPKAHPNALTPPPASIGSGPPPPADAAVVSHRPPVVRPPSRDQEELRKALAALPELGLNDDTVERLQPGHGEGGDQPIPVQIRQTRFGPIVTTPDGRMPLPTGWARGRTGAHIPGRHTIRDQIVQMQPDLAYLPWRLGDDCHLAREPAEKLETLSRALRDLLVATTPSGTGTGPVDPALLQPVLLGEPYENHNFDARRAALARRGRSSAPEPGQPDERWLDPEAIPALVQLLMAERTPTRLVLVAVLRKIPRAAATRALARLAVFDIAPEVRSKAIEALRDRPAEDYGPTLLDALRYPWPPVADHAAEALVALKDCDVIPSLIELLDRPDPQAPVLVSRHGEVVTVVPTVVKINHLKNCFLCHDQSGNPSTDLVRGRVPYRDQPLPPPVEYYAGSQTGQFVRAEVTYLRQDFSVTQPVEDADPWPSQQRFDYLVVAQPVSSPRETPIDGPAPPPEIPRESRATYPQRESVLYALRELTGKDPGRTSDAWHAAMTPAVPVTQAPGASPGSPAPPLR